MRWFAAHKIVTVILAVLILIVILFVCSWQLRGADGSIGGVARAFTSLIQKPVAALADTVTKKAGDALSGSSYSENQKLREENEQLKNQLAIERLKEEELSQLRELSVTLDAANPIQDRKIKTAGILSYEKSNAFNIFTIDIGTESGVERNSVVICGGGLVGRVLSSVRGSAKVVSIIDENNNVSFGIKRGADVCLGVCHGVGDGTLTGNLLDEDAFAEVGDAVYTSGLGGIYPAGIRIGTVTEASFTKDSALMSLSIDPTVYFKGIRKVLVLI
jgi:rod shape-determining protein MreC